MGKKHRKERLKKKETWQQKQRNWKTLNKMEEKKGGERPGT